MKKYFKHKINNLLVVNSIVTVHFFKFDKDFVAPIEAHDFWEIVYAHKEDIRCYTDGKEITLKQGEILFHKPNEVHSLRANGKTPPTVYIVSFDCRSLAMRFFENKKILLDELGRKYILAIMEEAKKSFNIPFSDPSTKKMEVLSNPSLGGVQLIKNYLEILLIGLMRESTETENGNKIFLSEGELGGKFIENIVEILSSSVNKRISIEDICKKTSYSKAYVFKKFKQATGKTIIEYFTDLKIEASKKMLKGGALSVKEIAEQLSFDTPNYFSKTFKKKTGLTPLEYKKRTGL